MAKAANLTVGRVANDHLEGANLASVAPTSKELVIGLVGYAGAGTSTAGERISTLLEAAGYRVYTIKFSNLIEELDKILPLQIIKGLQEGRLKFQRAQGFQDRGDDVRRKHGKYALSALAIKRIKELRGDAEAGSQKIAFVLDSIKHPDEVDLLRTVYHSSFRLTAVHCDREKRFSRLFGDEKSSAKYRGVDQSSVSAFMDRDAKDQGNDCGQRVRDAFHLAEFFLDNSALGAGGAGMNADIDRFLDLILGNGLIRPTAGEKAMYVAHASALQAACLSRQVGAALISSDGRLVASGKNDPPKFGGGTYDEDSKPDNRCFTWEFAAGDDKFVGCHNDRKKSQLYEEIADWLATRLADPIAEKIVPKNMLVGRDLDAEQRSDISKKIFDALLGCRREFEGMPGIKDAIEYSRSIHAEMAALMAASRGGISTTDASMYVTVFPCHNCARHLVAAGIKAVFFIEPYVKSLAFELHSDSISPDGGTLEDEADKRMVIAPFTGVGPRMYDDFFVKRGELKARGGRYVPQSEGVPHQAVRLRELESVEDVAIGLIKD